MSKGYKSATRTFLKCEERDINARFEANWIEVSNCHVLMQQLLSVAIIRILPKNLRHTLTRLCSFFSSICCKVIDSVKLDELEDEIVVILCELEMFFPPSFFDIMVHLVVHLVREVRLCGLVYLRWMYPVERYMKILKGYVKNHYLSRFFG